MSSEKKDQKEKEVKSIKKSTYSKKKKVKKISSMVRHSYCQHSIILLYQFLILVEILFLGHQQAKKVLKVQENLHHMQHKSQQICCCKSLGIWYENFNSRN